MKRILLVHWNSVEAEERAGFLRQAGYEVVIESDPGAPTVRAINSNTPDAFLIDLNRRPSHGRDVAIWLRQKKATRHIPLIFVEGDSERVAGVQELLPDAEYTEWSRIHSTLQRTIKKPPSDPVVPGIMDSYTGTPLPKKLGIRRDSVVMILNGPESFEQDLNPLPTGVTIRKQARGFAEIIVLFAGSTVELNRRFPSAIRALAEGGRIWIAWPKKSSGVISDLTQAVVRAYGLNTGLVDYKICAIDEVWSGLCFARRRT